MVGETQLYELKRYCIYVTAVFHLLFASRQFTKLIYPQMLQEVRQLLKVFCFRWHQICFSDLLQNDKTVGDAAIFDERCQMRYSVLHQLQRACYGRPAIDDGNHPAESATCKVAELSRYTEFISASISGECPAVQRTRKDNVATCRQRYAGLQFDV